ncbi:DUF6328 family protein [[Empedobacter] haloabium]|uniref:DUF6328 family protein n=1 Tax=[Empedobacter] haloabium TaxID=592317 RepID=A0ABZ1UQ38_9BURK
MDEQQPPAERDSLKDQMGHLIEEARMVLPGIQALFGFQTVAVFNERFADLPFGVQACHMVALALVVVAIALVMMPAAYHRLATPDRATLQTIKVCSRAICYALAPLAAGLSLDMFVVLHAVTSDDVLSIASAVASFALLIGLWFVYPLHRRRVHGYGATDAGA